ncbi:MAG: hypothetical protein DRR19_30905, partial [Candidatus Parabeggiatoa sp. nov. 1]
RFGNALRFLAKIIYLTNYSKMVGNKSPHHPTILDMVCKKIRDKVKYDICVVKKFASLWTHHQKRVDLFIPLNQYKRYHFPLSCTSHLYQKKIYGCFLLT